MTGLELGSYSVRSKVMKLQLSEVMLSSARCRCSDADLDPRATECKEVRLCECRHVYGCHHYVTAHYLVPQHARTFYFFNHISSKDSNCSDQERCSGHKIILQLSSPAEPSLKPLLRLQLSILQRCVLEKERLQPLAAED